MNLLCSHCVFILVFHIENWLKLYPLNLDERLQFFYFLVALFISCFKTGTMAYLFIYFFLVVHNFYIAKFNLVSVYVFRVFVFVCYI